MLIGLLVFSKPIIKSSIHLSTKMVRKAIVTLAWLLVNCLCFHKKTLFKPGWSQICSWYALHHDLEKPVNSTHSSFWSRERQSPTNLCLGSHWSKMGHNWRHRDSDGPGRISGRNQPHPSSRIMEYTFQYYVTP